MKLDQMHRRTVAKVNAECQADFLKKMLDKLSEEEKDVVRRGRNCKQGTLPRSTSAPKYRQSTGFEALVGFLFLTGQEQRLKEVLGFGE